MSGWSNQSRRPILPLAARDGQGPLQFQGLDRIGSKPKVYFLQLRQNHWHGLGMNWRNHGVCFRRQEGE
jgi:hypothetical protein